MFFYQFFGEFSLFSAIALHIICYIEKLLNICEPVKLPKMVLISFQSLQLTCSLHELIPLVLYLAALPLKLNEVQCFYSSALN